MNNWKDYVLDYFSDKSQFHITNDLKNHVISISSSDQNIKTKLAFIFKNDKYDEIEETQFYNDLNYNNSYCVQYFGGLSFSDEDINIINEIIKIPIEKGWLEKDFYFIGKKPYKTHFFYDKKSEFRDYVSYNSWFQGILSIFSLLSRTKLNEIGPMKKRKV